MIEKLNKFFTNSIEILANNQKEIGKPNQVIINEDFFKDEFLPNFIIGEQSVYVKEKLQEISKIKGPVLYWFEFDNTEDKNNLLRNKFTEYKDSLGKLYHLPNYRYTSSYKKQFCADSNVLYVGKVEKDFYQRIKTHLGYAASAKTAGMQLHHWYGKSVNDFGDLTLNYIVFNNEMNDLIAVLEKVVAKELKPLIGRY